MKKFSVLLFPLIFISISCKKAGTNLISKNDLAGSWLLKEYSGGFAYRVIIPTDSILITFKKSGKYSLSTNHVIITKGDFRITKATDSGLYYSETVINLLGDDGSQIIYGVILKSDSLFLSEGCCDGFSYTYIKQE
jgi:hypothetical protein